VAVLNLGIVAKIDLAEVRAPFIRAGLIVAAIAIAVIAAGTMVFFTVTGPMIRRLQESETRFRQLAENIKEVFWINDAETQAVVYMSPAYEEVWGSKCEKVYEQPEDWIDSIHPDDRERVKKAYYENAKKGEYSEEFRIVRPDGEERWILDRGFPVLDERGEAYRIAGIAEDITERKKVEEALLLNERRLTEAQRTGRIGDWSLNVESGTLHWSDEIYRIFGHEPGAFKPSYDRFFAAVHPEDIDKVKESEGKAFAKEGNHSVDHRIILPDGTVRWVHEEAVATLDKHGKATELAGTVQDITERKQAEEKVRRERKRANEYLAIAEAIIVCLDRTGGVTLINRRGLDVLGYEEDEMIGRNWFETTVPKDQAKEVQTVHAKVCSREIAAVEYIENEVLTKSGELRSIYWHNATLKDDNDAIIGSVSSGQDITERKRAEDRIKASLAEKKVLLKEVHHRVKNNLQTICSMLALQARAGRSKEVANALGDSERRIRVMAQVHENLCRSDDLGSIDALNYLRSIIQDIEESQLDGTGQVSFSDDIEDIVLDIDLAVPIGQIVSEMLSNCLKHAFPDGGSGNVRVSLKRLNGGDIELSVADDGVGLPEDFDIAGSKSLGLQLIDTLSMMIKGELSIGEPPGASFHIVFNGERP
jgi:PAS domain S-box-containing protein